MTKPVITPINVGYMRGDLDFWFKLPKDHLYAGTIEEIPMQCFHIANGERSVLVDASLHDFPDDHKVYEVPSKGDASLVEQLAEIGVQPEDITDVIITHAHFDHYNALSYLEGDEYKPTFPRAQHYLGVGDYNSDDFTELEERTFGLINSLGMLFLVDQPIDIKDSMAIIPIPGETPGHQMLMLATMEMQAYFAGDLYHHAIEFDHPELNVYWTSDKMPISKGRVASTALEHNAQVYFTHLFGTYHVELEDEQMVWRKT